MDPQPLTLWLTGLPASGKSTLAFGLERELKAAGVACTVLDGDIVRRGLNADLDFRPEARRENIRRVAEMARLVNDGGSLAIVAVISPYRADRERARRIVGPARFREVYLSASVATCEARDPKGLYRKARAGEIAQFTGVSAPYEPPVAAELVLDTATSSVEESLRALRSLLKD